MKPAKSEPSHASPPGQQRWASLLDWVLFLIGAAAIVWGIVAGAEAMGYNWQWYRVPRYIYRVIDDEVI